VNVTVMLPRSLRGAVEGRDRLSLGLPPSADVGDLLEALLTLYPKLRAHQASDFRSHPEHLNLSVAAASLRDGGGRLPLKEGQTLYLSASQPKRLVS